jgi:hypothetical protein
MSVDPFNSIYINLAIATITITNSTRTKYLVSKWLVFEDKILDEIQDGLSKLYKGKILSSEELSQG